MFQFTAKQSEYNIQFKGVRKKVQEEMDKQTQKLIQQKHNNFTAIPNTD